MPDEVKSELQLAFEHVLNGRRIVAEQRARIDRLMTMGHQTLEHEQTLHVFETTLRIFEEHEREMRRRTGISE